MRDVATGPELRAPARTWRLSGLISRGQVAYNGVPQVLPVEAHLASPMTKLMLHNRMELVAWAYRTDRVHD